MEGGGRVRLTNTQLKILGAIAASRRHPISYKELAESVGCCAKTVDRAIARLRNAGLVEVRNASTYVDGEHREVALTDVQLAVIGLMLGLGRERPFADDELAEKMLPAAIEASCR